MTAFDFLKWCFQGFWHGFWAVFIVSCLSRSMAKILLAARGVRSDD